MSTWQYHWLTSQIQLSNNITYSKLPAMAISILKSTKECMVSYQPATLLMTSSSSSLPKPDTTKRNTHQACSYTNGNQSLSPWLSTILASNKWKKNMLITSSRCYRHTILSHKTGKTKHTWDSHSNGTMTTRLSISQCWGTLKKHYDVSSTHSRR